MPEPEPKHSCLEHSGVISRIIHLETENGAQWKRIDDMKSKLDKIPAQFNAILVGVVLILLGVIVNLVK